MIRIDDELSLSALREIKLGDMVTDTFSKTGLVENIDRIDDGLYLIFKFFLVTGRVIEVRR
ncbi:hypothetical protein ABIB40_001293 [Pedobacter sp. UYP30]|uniref:hypothetical protein n=1 Tax=Pedobacter sp. UYP30 TaxID=1756400 RepID=UPI0033973A67